MSEPGAGRLYRFVQFEYTWPLGPADGRYVIREHAGEDPHHVLVVSTHSAPRRRRGGRWGREPEAPAGPVEAPVSRATLVDAAPLDGETAAEAWLDRAAGDDAATTLAEAAGLLNTALRAHRAATADPYARDVLPSQAAIARAGYGAGFEVAEGDWSQARALPLGGVEGKRRDRRMQTLRPQERLAALLSGRDAVLACEELVLRARLDLDGDRPREAALQAHIALEAAVSELQAYRSRRELADRVARLDALREQLAAAANEALQGGPAQDTVDRVREAVEQLEAALRVRAAGAEY